MLVGGEKKVGALRFENDEPNSEGSERSSSSALSSSSENHFSFKLFHFVENQPGVSWLSSSDSSAGGSGTSGFLSGSFLN